MGRLVRAVAAAAWLSRCSALYVLLTAQPECFVVEQPLDTQLAFAYEMPSGEELGNTRKEVEVKLTDRRTHEVVFTQSISDNKGELQLSTVSDAPHDLCLVAVPTPDWSKPLLLDFSLNLGHGERYYSGMAAVDQMDKLQLEVVKLNDELAQILSEADYMKEREVKFHKKSERVNMAAAWWPIVQIAILVLTAIFQAKNLKAFFAGRSFY